LPYQRLKANGFTFVFKYEDDYPDLLHIFARHRKETDDAMYIFFNGVTAWNQAQNRFETFLDGEGLFWFWIDEPGKVVMVVSCFDQ